MRASIRPYVTSGVALVGASVIAVTPIQPAATADARVASPVVQLAAVPSPFELYPQVIERTAANIAALTNQYFADPFPVIGGIVGNQLASVENAVAALQDGDGAALLAAAVDVVIEPVRSLGAILGGYWYTVPGDPYAANVWYLFMADAIVNPVISSAASVIAATYEALEDMVEAVFAVDPIGVLNAVINIPAHIIDGTLNEFGDLPGLFSPVDPNGLWSLFHPKGGPIANLIDFWQRAGNDISLRAPAPAETSNLHAAELTLTSDPSTADKELVGGESVTRVEDNDALVDDVAADTIISNKVDNDLDGEEGPPAAVNENAAADDELIEAHEIDGAEYAAEELTGEPDSPANPEAEDADDPVTEDAEGSNGGQDTSPSTAE